MEAWETPEAIAWAEGYARRSKRTLAELRALGRDVRPCSCDYEECEGWQMVNVQLYEEDLRWRAEVRAAFAAEDAPPAD